ncbi:DUF6907 domain-containing protein [Streptomyces griseofuscus]|uniref:DUF6907 domain-containing protein n=1 Tax=Streptomyces griseofuscus TaxID=146922 RepID=UPI0033C8019D
MSVEQPITVTLATSDHGDVTLPEPSWCLGHALHDPETRYADITHSSLGLVLAFRHLTLMTACMIQTPNTASGSAGPGGRSPGVFVSPLGETLDPIQLYDLAARLDTYSDQLRDLADQLTQTLNGVDQLGSKLTTEQTEAEKREKDQCERCHRPFDPADTRFDGHDRHRDTRWCRACVDNCREGSAEHVCVICEPSRYNGGDR